MNGRLPQPLVIIAFPSRPIDLPEDFVERPHRMIQRQRIVQMLRE
jgi:hypothetical protein